MEPIFTIKKSPTIQSSPSVQTAPTTPTYNMGVSGNQREAIKLALAIRQRESGGNYNARGGSGEFGAYQYMPGTWESTARKYLGSPNAPMTPENQNKATVMKINDLLDQGYTKEQVAAIWNSGSATNWENKVGVNSWGQKYDVPAYVQGVIDNYNNLEKTVKDSKPMPDLYKRIDMARSKGMTDTDILEDIASRNRNISMTIERLREKAYDSNRSDREILNHLSLKLSGETPKLPSVPLPEFNEMEDLDKSNYAERMQGHIQDYTDNMNELTNLWAKDKNLGKTFLGATGQGLNLVWDTVFETAISPAFKLGKKVVNLFLSDEQEAKVDEAKNEIAQDAASFIETVQNRLDKEFSEEKDDSEFKSKFDKGAYNLLKDVYDWYKEPENKFAVEGVYEIISTLTLANLGKKGAQAGFATTLKNQTDDLLRGGIDDEAIMALKNAKKLGQEAVEAEGAKQSARILSKLNDTRRSVSRFLTAQYTGLKTETVEQLLKNGARIQAAQRAGLERISFGNRIITGIEKRLDDLAATGKGYDKIRKSNFTANIPIKLVDDTLEEFGIKIKKGVIKTTKDTKPMSTTDISALQDFYNTFGKETKLTANQFLNAREKLSQMSAYETGKTGALTPIARNLRSAYDDFGKGQIKGLKELDLKYSSEIDILKKVKKDYFNKDGSIKDGAFNKLANLTGKGKELILKRVEKVVPGVREELNILKAIEDIVSVKEAKTGIYTRGIIGGGLAVTGNPILGIISMIAMSPSVVVPFLISYGKMVGRSKEFINRIVNKISRGLKLTTDEYKFLDEAVRNKSKKLEENIKRIRPGLTIEDVSKGVATVDDDVVRTLRGTKGMTADDIQKTYPNIKLTKDVSAKDIYGNKVIISDGEKLTPYELKGNKILLQDGETYIVTKNQFQNIQGNSIKAEGKPFAPELEGLEETVKGGAITETPTKYSQYQLPGGENYKEILIKAPTRENLPYILKKGDDVLSEYPNLKEAQKALEGKGVGHSIEPKTPTRQPFKSSHWDDPNVIAHLRLNERTYKGKKVTFMEELQSDWAREGRNKGFKGDKGRQEFDNYVDSLKKKYDTDAAVINQNLLTESEKIKYRELFDSIQDFGDAVPFNENLKNWQELSVKRALKEAVDNNSDYFAWISGKQTSARYNLSKQIDEIKWARHSQTGEKLVTLSPKNADSIGFLVNEDGVITKKMYGGADTFVGKKLDEVLGKGLSDKIMPKFSGNLSGEGLKFGGEWADNLYDRQVKSIIKDLTGQKVETLDMGLPIDKAKNTLMLKTKDFADLRKLKETDLKVGVEILDSSSPYIITDVLGDGKFKAIETEALRKIISNARGLNVEGKLTEKSVNFARERITGFNNLLDEFDVSSMTAGQQAIKLTPEVKAKIKGEAPAIETSGKMFEEQGSNIKSFIDKAYKEAPLAKKEIDTTANIIAKKYNGIVAEAPLKKQEKVLLNIKNKYNGDTSRVSDIARNTIIVDKDSAPKVFKELQKNPNYFSGKFVDPKTDPLGYSGYNTKYRASNGHIAEIQINTPSMIYAKEPAESAITQLGKELYNKLNKQYNGTGGKGHKYYDAWSKSLEELNLKLADKLADKIAKESSTYYKPFIK